MKLRNPGRIPASPENQRHAITSMGAPQISDGSKSDHPELWSDFATRAPRTQRRNLRAPPSLRRRRLAALPPKTGKNRVARNHPQSLSVRAIRVGRSLTVNRGSACQPPPRKGGEVPRRGEGGKPRVG